MTRGRFRNSRFHYDNDDDGYDDDDDGGDDDDGNDDDGDDDDEHILNEHTKVAAPPQTYDKNKKIVNTAGVLQYVAKNVRLRSIRSRTSRYINGRKNKSLKKKLKTLQKYTRRNAPH